VLATIRLAECQKESRWVLSAVLIAVTLASQLWSIITLAYFICQQPASNFFMFLRSNCFKMIAAGPIGVRSPASQRATKGCDTPTFSANWTCVNPRQLRRRKTFSDGKISVAMLMSTILEYHSVIVYREQRYIQQAPQNQRHGSRAHSTRRWLEALGPQQPRHGQDMVHQSGQGVFGQRAHAPRTACVTRLVKFG